MSERGLTGLVVEDEWLLRLELAEELTRAGWRVAEAARKAYPLLPVIYVSANPLQPARQVAGSLFLGKPVNIAQLLAACDRLVRRE